MDLKEKRAVLKLAGFEVTNESQNGWEWEHRGKDVISEGYFPNEIGAWKSAWKYMMGADNEELHDNPWEETE